MIELGCLNIIDSDSIIEARKKVRKVAIWLSCTEIRATRIEAVISETCRLSYNAGDVLKVYISIRQIKGYYGIHFKITGIVKKANLLFAMRFFDEFSVKTEQDSSITIEAFLFFKEVNPMNDSTLIEEIHQIITLPSRAELTREITAKNAELELQTEQLRVARNIAEAAAQAKADFLANMSHEIRTPMNAIIGMSHLVQKTKLSVKQSDYIEKIQASSQHLLGIINDILDFSKIEAGKLIIENIEFEMENVLKNVFNLIGEKCLAKGLELIFDVDTGLPKVLCGDPLRLGQILINYANNAVKFTENGEIIIRIRKIEQFEEYCVVRFEVQDTGIGIEEEQKDMLFQSFQQADTSTTRKYGGTGLGLAISKKLATLMGGEVGFDTEYGKGSVFWFTTKLLLKQNEKVVVAKVIGIENRKMLVVDDNLQARQVLGEMLRAGLCLVEEAESGETALQMILQANNTENPYEIVFIDMQMPRINGIETVRKSNKLKLLYKPVYVMVTGYGREEIFKAAATVGIESVLLKPVSNNVLLATINRILDSNGQEAIKPEYINVNDYNEGLALIRGANILLVEDNELNQQVAMELLSDAGFKVEFAENGKTAVQKVLNKSYDIVLMDMQMPVMDGLEATRCIRADNRLFKIPIVAMTANAMESDRKKCLEAGMNDHLPKPIEPEQLFSMLVKWISPSLPKENSEIAKVVKLSSENVHDGFDLNINIVGLDTELGLKRVLNKQKIYINLLRKYVSGQKETFIKLDTALSSGDWDTAERLIHTLKGVSATIGAVLIQEKASELENVILARITGYKLNILIADTKELLEDLIKQLEKVLPEEEEVRNFSGSIATTQEMAFILKELIPHLETSKPKKCKEILDAHRDLVWPDELKNEKEELEKHISKYKYKEALAILNIMTTKL